MADDLKEKIEVATSRILVAQQERDKAEHDRNLHEETYKRIRNEANEARAKANIEATEHERLSREASLRMATLAKELEQLRAVLAHSQVAKTVEDSAALQKKAQDDAEATLKRLQEKEQQLDEKGKKLDELIGKAAEAVAKAE